MFGFGQLIDILKKDPKKIVFTEGNDPRILEAASRLLAGTFLHPILVGNPDEILKAAEESGFNIRGAEIIDPANYDRFDEMVELFCELRKIVLRFISAAPHLGQGTFIISTIAFVLRHSGKLGQARNLPKRPILYTIIAPHLSHTTSDTSSGTLTFSIVSDAFSTSCMNGP